MVLSIVASIATTATPALSGFQHLVQILYKRESEIHKTRKCRNCGNLNRTRKNSDVEPLPQKCLFCNWFFPL